MNAEVEMPDHITNRDAIIRGLRQELVGPCPLGRGIDCTLPVQLDDAAMAYLPYHQLGSGEEILQRDSPSKRYGIGILYPIEARVGPQELGAQLPPLDPDYGVAGTERGTGPLLESAAQDCAKIADRAEARLPEADTDDFDLSTANAYRPSSMAVSFLMRLPEDAEVSVKATGGRYAIKDVSIVGRDRVWWLRSPVHIAARFRREDFPTSVPGLVSPRDLVRDNLAGLNLQLELFARPQPERPDEFLITVCLVNRQPADGRIDLQCLFQAHIDIQLGAGDSPGVILPYPTAAPLDDDECSQELLYREKLTFAVGHGCAADWKRDAASTRADSVSAECLPVFEAPNITPDVRTGTGQPLVALMRALAGLDPGDDGLAAVEAIVIAYEDWIARQQSRIGDLDERFRKTAHAHLARCTRSASRMRDGLSLLAVDPQIRQAFTLANLAILIQQVRSRREARIASFDPVASTLHFEESYNPLDLDSVGARGRAPKVIGYEQRAQTVVYACPDRRCEFHESMPLYVIDEDIYKFRPALVIGTVDKFAMLAWKPEARSLFGIASDGARAYSPPGLIIQDELHLISGPLGSMVGLYEPIIEELCTDRRESPPAKPKIVCSTATIRSFSEQVHGLYAGVKFLSWPKVSPFGGKPKRPAEIPVELSVFPALLGNGDPEEIANGREFFNAYSKKFKKVPEGYVAHKSFKRLHRYRFSPTAWYGNQEVHLHPWKARRLSVREALRIQTVPDEYTLPEGESLSAKFKLISNGVPCVMAFQVASGLRSFLKGPCT